MNDFNFEDLTNNAEPILDFKQIFKDALIDPAEEIKQQPIALSIGESNYKGNSYPIPFGSYGDFSCIVGASKSRKTFFKSMVEAAYIGGRSNIYNPSIKGHNNDKKFVLSFDTEQSHFHTQRVQRRVLELIGGKSNIYNPSIKGHNNEKKFVLSFDTEQSHFHTQRVQRRVLELIGGNCEFYKTFGLRGYSPKERFDFIDWIVFESEFKDKIGLMSIDGYVDLVTDFNSLEQATGLTEKLLNWTAKGNMHCTGILHKNFGSAKPVGHVGSSVLKKAETVVFIEKDENDVTIVKCEYSRNQPFKEIKFNVDGNDWLPKEIQSFL
jgi:hypothetical protein